MVASEGEECEGDERVGGFESERHAGEEPDFDVGGFDRPVGEPVFEAGVDRLAVPADLAADFDELGDAGSLCPLQPGVECVFVVLASEFEDVA